MLKVMFEEKRFAGFEKATVKQMINEKGIKECAWIFEKSDVTGKEYYFISDESSEVPSSLLTDRSGTVSLLVFMGDYGEAELVGEIVKKAFMVSRFKADKIIDISKNSGIISSFQGGIESFLGENIAKLNEKQSIILVLDEDRDINDIIN